MNNFKNYLRVASKIAPIFPAVVLMAPLISRKSSRGWPPARKCIGHCFRLRHRAEQSARTEVRARWQSLRR